MVTTLVSTTLTANSEATIGPALESVVGQVDACIVIDTGVSDGTLEVAREVCGGKFRVRSLVWPISFADARNFALLAAREYGADWAVTLDTDERLSFAPGFVLRDELASLPETNVLYASAHDRSYMKERVVRLASAVRWYGFTHELTMPYQEPGQAVHCAGLSFRELVKTPAQLRAKHERDVGLLSAMVMVDERSPRWICYLAGTLQNLERPAEAIPLFVVAAQLWNWEGEGATCAYRAAGCCWELGEWARAVEILQQGLAAQPDSRELEFYLKIAKRKVQVGLPGGLLQ